MAQQILMRTAFSDVPQNRLILRCCFTHLKNNPTLHRHLSLYIVKCMHLDAAFMFVELRPFKHRQTKVDGCGIKGVDMTFKLEDFVYNNLIMTAKVISNPFLSNCL